MAFVVKEGTVVTANAPPNQPSMILDFNAALAMRSQTYGWIYKHQPNVRTVVSFLARNIAQLKLKMYQRVSDSDRKELEDHEMMQLLLNPNPDTTPFRFMTQVISDKAIYDVAYVLKVKIDGMRALIRLPPEKVEPVGKNWLMPQRFRLLGDQKQPEFERDQVIYLRGYNPGSNLAGSSPIEALRVYLVEEYNAAKWREQMWKNGARTMGYIQRPLEAPRWANNDRERFARNWKSQYTGDGPEAGGTPVLEDGMTFQSASVTPDEAQYIESRKLTREECANAYHIPPPLVGILDHATFSNIEMQHQMLYQDALGPWLTDIEQEFKLQLLPDFETGTKSKKIYLEFNIQEKLKGSFEEQSDAFSTSVGAPWMTVNEARARMNLPAKEKGDELIMPLNVAIGGQASPQDGQTEQRPQPSNQVRPQQPQPQQPQRPQQPSLNEGYEDVLSKFFDRQTQVIASKAGVPQEVINKERWYKELLNDLKGEGDG